MCMIVLPALMYVYRRWHISEKEVSHFLTAKKICVLWLSTV